MKAKAYSTQLFWNLAHVTEAQTLCQIAIASRFLYLYVPSSQGHGELVAEVQPLGTHDNVRWMYSMKYAYHCNITHYKTTKEKLFNYIKWDKAAAIKYHHWFHNENINRDHDLLYVVITIRENGRTIPTNLAIAIPFCGDKKSCGYNL